MSPWKFHKQSLELLSPSFFARGLECRCSLAQSRATHAAEVGAAKHKKDAVSGRWRYHLSVGLFHRSWATIGQGLPSAGLGCQSLELPLPGLVCKRARLEPYKLCACEICLRDVFGMPDNITLLDAVLVQTSLAKSDLEEHPPLKALKTQVSVHWLPLHHSNAHELRASPWERVHRVGVHTVHTDKDLEGLVTEVLAAHSDEAGLPPDERPHFVHMDPGKLFEPNEGKITTPQHTDALYQQLTTLQIGFAKQSGCLSEWWSCSRWKTGQRLVNMLSVGIPTIVWGDARGHLDITGLTVLHLAAVEGRLGAVQFLVDFSEDLVLMQDIKGNTAAHLATARNHVHVVHFLIKRSPRLLEVINREGCSLLHMAVRSGFVALAKLCADKNPAIVEMQS
eukprot:g10115.t1